MKASKLKGSQGEVRPGGDDDGEALLAPGLGGEVRLAGVVASKLKGRAGRSGRGAGVTACSLRGSVRRSGPGAAVVTASKIQGWAGRSGQAVTMMKPCRL